MTKLVIITALVGAGCGSKDERKPMADSKECDTYVAAMRRVKECTKLGAAERTRLEGSFGTYRGMLEAQSKATGDAAEDLVRVMLNTCKSNREALETALKAAGC